MLEHYYNSKAAHNYMNIDNFDLLIFDYLKNLDLKNSDVLEIGSGFGRYTKALSLISNKVYATEPNDFMHEQLTRNFNNIKNVNPLARNIEELLHNPFTNHIDCIFMFHVLHHLEKDSFAALRKLTDKLKASLFIIEPNHLNPLFFFQIFVTKDMKFQDEKRMFIDNSRLLVDKYFQHGFSINRTNMGFFPPNLTKTLAKASQLFTNSRFLSTKLKNPFSAYSILKIKPL